MIVNAFTFHYGSILIPDTLDKVSTFDVIYIPLWFYSNNGMSLYNIVNEWYLHSTMVLF